MTQIIDLIGLLPNPVRGIIHDYTAPNTQDVIDYTITHFSNTSRSHEVCFNYVRLAASVDAYYKLGQAFGLSHTRCDEIMRLFAIQTFVLEIARPVGGRDNLLRSEHESRAELHLGAVVAHGMGEGHSVEIIYQILQRVGLISEKAGDNGKMHYSLVPQPDEPQGKVMLTRDDVHVVEFQERLIRVKLKSGS